MPSANSSVVNDRSGFIPAESPDDAFGETEFSGSMVDGELEVADVFTILPPDFGETDLVDFDPILLAQQRIEMLDTSGESSEEINVVIDEEVEDQAVEMVGTKCNLGFALTPPVLMPYLVIYLKTLRKYVGFEVQVLDTKGDRYIINASNRQSMVRAKRDEASLPIELIPGWNRVCLDLEDLCKRAFGVNYHSTLAVRVHPNCRLWKLFFQAENYADCELPPYLRVLEGARSEGSEAAPSM